MTYLMPRLLLLATAAIVASSGAYLDVRAETGPAEGVPGERPVRSPSHDGSDAGVLDEALRPSRRSGGGSYAPERAGFRLRVGGEPVPYRVMAALALPGEEVLVELPDGRDGFGFRFQAGTSSATARGWRWRAPDRPGVYAARVVGPSGGVDLNLLVAHPATAVRGGVLNGYRIGAYVKKPLRGDPAYLPPAGFVEVGESERDVLASPHFTLEQFLCKQPGEPRYISFSAPLVRKLEAVLEAVNADGIPTPSLHVMSGFRTPAYNRAIGNTTVYSRHLWGDAADVFVDVDGDGYMDDLNGDGRSNVADARILAAIVERVEAEAAEGVEPGGMGVYRRNAVRGPFVHVDARGYRARW